MKRNKYNRVGRIAWKFHLLGLAAMLWASGFLGTATAGPVTASPITAGPMNVPVAEAQELPPNGTEDPQYNRDIRPLLTRYCGGCHNDSEAEAGFSVASYASLMKGGEHGRVVRQGSPEQSRLLQLIRGTSQPKMPPQDEPQPTAAELERLAAWIRAGATAPPDAAPLDAFHPPSVKPQGAVKHPLTAIAVDPSTSRIAIGRFGECVLFAVEGSQRTEIARFPIPAQFGGKVTCLEFSDRGRLLLVGTGVPGVWGQALLVDWQSGQIEAQFGEHRDQVYAARISPNGRWIATAGYDREIQLFDRESGKRISTLKGHNDAIYDLAFSHDSRVLASASGDETIKLWDVETGKRLDTLSQPEGEQYTVCFSPDDKWILSAGEDRRIRVWRFVSKDKVAINPLVYSRFAHEGAVLRLAFADKGRRLISLAEDRSAKVWSTQQYRPLGELPKLPALAHGVAVLDRQLALACGDGRLRVIPWTSEDAELSAHSVPQPAEATATPATSNDRMIIQEVEPNHRLSQAQQVTLPVTIEGTIHRVPDAGKTPLADVDMYRFHASRGSAWVIEVQASRNKSPLDSFVEVLDEDGRRMPRALLEAVRESYFTFRGKDSSTSDDFRLHNWQEMELNEYLYADGEVTRLWLYPRGPDSGFKVYPGFGARFTYFGTSPTTHALQAPCYIVRPHPPGTQLIPNGLPTFQVYYENDDDGRRQRGSDSFLTFRAAKDGNYHVAIRDVRGFQGTKYKYQLTIRPQAPDFDVTIQGKNLRIPRGSGREIRLNASRVDEFSGPIQVHFANVPDSLTVTNPVVIEANQEFALASVVATGEIAPTEAEWNAIEVTAEAMIDDELRRKLLGNLGKIEFEEPRARIEILPATAAESPATPWELVIHPGETVMAKVRVDRRGHKGPISFGKEDSGRNLPHGVFVDNIGLNGLLIVPDSDEREFFITAAPWVPETRRLFHLKANVHGGVTSLPILLVVQPLNSSPAE